MKGQRRLLLLLLLLMLQVLHYRFMARVDPPRVDLAYSVVVHQPRRPGEQRFGNNVRKAGPYSFDGPETARLRESCILGWRNARRQGHSRCRRPLASSVVVGNDCQRRVHPSSTSWNVVNVGNRSNSDELTWTWSLVQRNREKGAQDQRPRLLTTHSHAQVKVLRHQTSRTSEQYFVE